ncbi:MAG: sulfurtransferase [Acidobacteria bacterium]|nr:sulfurtransferase [Acidobacteriota bacterium]
MAIFDQHHFSELFRQFCFDAVLVLLMTYAATVKAQAQPATRAESIVSPAWVKALLDFQSGQATRPSGYINNRFVILETSWANLNDAKDYRAEHLPGAIHLNTDELENGYPRWLLRPLQELQNVIGAHGITPETTVIVYGKQTIAAARVWWVLNYAGVKDVRLLNGGLAAWKSAGYATEATINQPLRTRFSAQPRTKWLATTDYVRQKIRSRDTLLADARSQTEFLGERSGYEYMDFKGRIPSAISIGDADDAARLYVNADGSLRDASEILAMWKAAGLLNDGREVIFYCGSGWRSSLAFLYAWVLGFDRIRNYSDGWAGWSTLYSPDPRAKGNTPGWRQQRTRNPIVTGAPKS